MWHLIQTIFRAWKQSLYVFPACFCSGIHLLRKQHNMEKNTKRKYTTVHIPRALAELIDKIIENGEFAYASRSEFIKDAVRRFLEYHGYYPQNKPKFKNPELSAELLENLMLLTRSKEGSKKSL